MNPALTRLLADLERFGIDNDQRQTARPQRMLNITRDTGEFLAVLVHATGARAIIEVGTSNGYSTLWLADAASATGGAVTTIESSSAKLALAARNFEAAGLAASIKQVNSDAASALAACEPDSCDLLFLDADRDQYLAWWPAIERVLRPGGLLVVDNAISHAAEMAAFFDLIRQDAAYVTALVPVGKGEFLATRVAGKAGA